MFTTTHPQISRADYMVFVMKYNVYEEKFGPLEADEYFKLQAYIYKWFFYMLRYERACIPKDDWVLFY